MKMKMNLTIYPYKDLMKFPEEVHVLHITHKQYLNIFSKKKYNNINMLKIGRGVISICPVVTT